MTSEASDRLSRPSEDERIVRGVAVPRFLYGTAWKEERTEELTRQALLVGFRGIDTANQRKHYVEAGVGAAIRAPEGGTADAAVRPGLFLQTKFTYERGQDHRLPYDPSAPFREQVAQSYASSLEHLGTDHIDSYVLHGPHGASGIDDADRETWEAMEALAQAGKVSLLGISNVSAAQLEELVRSATVKPAFVQNRCYASRGWDGDVRAVCRDHDIVYQGFSLLTANRAAVASQTIATIAADRGLTPAQVVFAFALALGMLPLTGSSSREHLEQDLAALDIALSGDEVERIEALR